MSSAPALQPAAAAIRLEEAGSGQRPAAVEALFDQLARTYQWHGYLAAGLTGWWRRQLLKGLSLGPGQVVIDLMTGTGELWPGLLARVGTGGRVRAVDFSAAMLTAADRRRQQLGARAVSLHRADACRSGLAAASADAVVCAFGLKTLAPEQLPALAAEIYRLLKPGGTAALVELTVPAHGWPRHLCLGYLRLLNRLLRRLGGSLLAHTHLTGYAGRFPDMAPMVAAGRAAGLEIVAVEKLTAGVATVLRLRRRPAGEECSG